MSVEIGIVAIAMLAIVIALFDVKRQNDELVKFVNNLDAQAKSIVEELKRIDGNVNYLYNRQNGILDSLQQNKEEEE